MQQMIMLKDLSYSDKNRGRRSIWKSCDVTTMTSVTWSHWRRHHSTATDHLRIYTHTHTIRDTETEFHVDWQ